MTITAIEDLAAGVAGRDADEFICRECGRLIISVPAQEPPPTICEACRWLDEFVVDAVEREEIRRKIVSC